MNDLPSAPAPLLEEPAPISRRSRRSQLAVASGAVVLCLFLAIGGYAATRLITNGRVGTGARTLTVVNGLSEPVCALQIAETEPNRAFSRNKLGADRLRPDDVFELVGLDEISYDLRGTTCAGRSFAGLALSMANGDRTWIISEATISSNT